MASFSNKQTPTKQKKQTNNGSRSPFFAPTTPKVIAQTPGGTHVSVKSQVKEHKSTVIGAAANLMNAIVGAGIVSIPFALKQSGMVTGVLLVALCASLTFKSLRLLVETAKHVNVPSYETLAEACFGTAGFLFVSLNMYVLCVEHLCDRSIFILTLVHYYKQKVHYEFWRHDFLSHDYQRYIAHCHGCFSL